MPVYETGRLVSTEGILTDVTDERLAQDQLKEAQRLARLGNWSWNVSTGELVWSEEIFRIFGRDPNLSPPHIFEHAQLFPPENWQQVEAVFRHAAQTGESYILDTAFVRQDGQRGHMLAHGASIRDEQGRVVKIFGTLQDITDRRRLEQQLLDISEREQRRIGQDLHDGVGQQLAAMRFQSSTLLQKMASRKKVSLAEVERLDTLLEETLKQVRNLSRGLHPVSLDSQGLMHGLRELARQCQALFGVECVFACADAAPLHDQRAALNLYRIAQEAMRNAAVHGAPQHIRIELSASGDAISLVIADDGRGLPANIKDTTGLGLEIMRYRAAYIGASCDIQSRPGDGVTIRCVWRPST